MAYVTQYKVAFTNESFQEVEILIQKSNGSVVDIEEYAAVSVKTLVNGDEGKYGMLFGTTLEMELDIRPEQDDLDILETAKDREWKVVATIEDKPLFTGFILADDGGVPFQDLPYNRKITATDGIGLLKEKDLQDLEGEEFDSHHSMISLIAACLNQTGLELPIRVYDNIYHSSFNNRDDDYKWDFVSQTFLEYRTFLKDATDFVSCHEALEIMFKDAFRLQQWHGQWVISRLGQIQYEPFPKYYTLYDYQGLNPVGYEDSEEYGLVGKKELIYPHGEDQMRYVKKASKSTASTYSYEIWPELPRNNKFERGQEVASGVALDELDEDGDGNVTEVVGTFKMFDIPDWTWGAFNFFDPLNLSSTSTNEPLQKRVYNVYESELNREIVFNQSVGQLGALKSQAIPVVQGDRIKFGLDRRAASSFNSRNNDWGAMIYVVSPSGAWYFLNGLSPTSDKFGKWFKGDDYYDPIPPPLTIRENFIYVNWGEIGADKTKFASVTVESSPIPISGELYILLLGSSERVVMMRNIDFEYFPFAAGGFKPVKGEKWTFTQTAQNWPDKSEEEVYLSDNLHKVFKGCLLNSAGVPLSADFYRLGVSESKRYLQLTNYYKFQLEQRRYWMIEGSFSGLMYNTLQDPDSHYPLALHKQYRFTDLETPRRFMLGAPLEMDLIKGWTTARFYEVFVATQIFFDGTRAGTQEFKYIF
jgi:hypothetical protein